MQAKPQKVFFAVKDHVILPFLHRQALMYCILRWIHGRLGLGIPAEMLTRLVCMAFRERGRGGLCQGYVQLQTLRITALPRSCCTGTLPVKRWSHCCCRVRSSKTPPRIHRHQGTPWLTVADDMGSCFMEL